MIKYLFCVALIVMGSVKGNNSEKKNTLLVPEKKLNLQVTVIQAQTILQALNECDCPQKTAGELRQYVINEYNTQFPQPKVDTTKTKKP